MRTNAYYNGIFTSVENIKIPLTDRSVFFGDGIYDAAIGRNGKIFMLDDHVDRFFSNAKELDIPINFSKDELKNILLRLARHSSYECYFLYFQLTRYSEKRTHTYPETNRSNLLVTLTEQSMPNNDKALKLMLVKDIRYEMCHIKTLNLIPAVIASRKATLLGKDEAVFHRNGTVTECAHSNIHIISNSVLITHPLDNFILPGISRKHMIEVAGRLGVAVKERDFSVYELFKADEVLVTSSSKLAVTASSVDYMEFASKKDSIGKLICNEMLADFVKFTEKDTTYC